jgi:hypothetical protein
MDPDLGLKGGRMTRYNWRELMALALGLALAASVGCRSTATTRKGVTSVESAGPPHESVLETVSNSKPDPNPIVPASFNTPATGGECSH